MDKIFGERIPYVEYYDRPGSYLVDIKEGLVATVKTPKGYFLLGGGIDDGENHEECIKRECIEEIGFDVNVKGYICSAEIFGLHERLGYFHPIQYYYYGDILRKVKEPIESDHDLEWISLEDIETKMYIKSQAWAIQQYLELLSNSDNNI